MKHIYFFFILILIHSTISAQWTQVAAPDSFRTDHSFGFAISDTGYLVTGNTDDGASAAFYRYNADLNEWSQLPDFPGGTRGFGIGDVFEGKAYFGFGYGASPDSSNNELKNDLWVYDPETGLWTELSACPCEPRFHPAFVCHQGNIYVGLGNASGLGNFKDWWQYNIENDTWAQKTDLPDLERHHPYQFAIGDYVYTGFGHGSEGDPNIYKSWFQYDPINDSWLRVEDIPDQGRVAGTQFSHNNYGYVLSGDGEDHDSMLTGEFWQYDPSYDEWTELEPHPGFSRWAPASFIIDHEVYIINGSSFGDYQDEAYKFDLGEPDPILSINPINSETQAFTVFPNPFSDQFSLDLQIDHTNFHIDLVDINGKILQNLNPDSFNNIKLFNELQKGIYFLNLYDDDRFVGSKKIVKD